MPDQPPRACSSERLTRFSRFCMRRVGSFAMSPGKLFPKAEPSTSVVNDVDTWKEETGALRILLVFYFFLFAHMYFPVRSLLPPSVDRGYLSFVCSLACVSVFAVKKNCALVKCAKPHMERQARSGENESFSFSCVFCRVQAAFGEE